MPSQLDVVRSVKSRRRLEPEPGNRSFLLCILHLSQKSCCGAELKSLAMPFRLEQRRLFLHLQPTLQEVHTG